MFGANIKPRPLGEVAAYAAGEGNKISLIKKALSVCIRRQLSRRESLLFLCNFLHRLFYGDFPTNRKPRIPCEFGAFIFMFDYSASPSVAPSVAFSSVVGGVKPESYPGTKHASRTISKVLPLEV